MGRIKIQNERPKSSPQARSWVLIILGLGMVLVGIFIRADSLFGGIGSAAENEQLKSVALLVGIIPGVIMTLGGIVWLIMSKRRRD